MKRKIRKLSVGIVVVVSCLLLSVPIGRSQEEELSYLPIGGEISFFLCEVLYEDEEETSAMTEEKLGEEIIVMARITTSGTGVWESKGETIKQLFERLDVVMEQLKKHKYPKWIKVTREIYNSNMVIVYRYRLIPISD